MKVLLADDHRLMLDGIRRALEDDGGFEIVGETQNGAQVLPLVGQTSPDLVVLDVRMPNMDGLQCLEEIRRRHPKVKVVMLSASTTPDLIDEALRRGASAYVLKTVDPSDLPSTLRQVIGGTVFSTVGRHRVVDAERRQGGRAHGAGDRDPHRARERQVERRDREGALGHPADGEVPPDERLPQARGQEPRRRGEAGLSAGPDPAPARRRVSSARPAGRRAHRSGRRRREEPERATASR